MQEVDIKQKEEVLKMPNSTEELLDEEVLKTNSSEFPEIDNGKVLNEINAAQSDSDEDTEAELSKSVENSNLQKTDDTEQQKPDKKSSFFNKEISPQ